MITSHVQARSEFDRVTADLDALEKMKAQAAEIAPVAVPICECGKRLADTACPDRQPRCVYCAKRYARGILRQRRAQFEHQRRVAREYTKMAIPKSRNAA